MLNPVQEDQAAAKLKALDDVDEVEEENDTLDEDIEDIQRIARDDPDTVVMVDVPRRRRLPYMARVAREVKVVFGTPKFTEANRLCVRRKAIEIMQEHRVRISHRAAMIDEIVALVFVPSLGEVRANELLASMAAHSRRRDANIDWHNSSGQSMIARFANL